LYDDKIYLASSHVADKNLPNTSTFTDCDNQVQCAKFVSWLCGTVEMERFWLYICYTKLYNKQEPNCPYGKQTVLVKTVILRLLPCMPLHLSVTTSK